MSNKIVLLSDEPYCVHEDAELTHLGVNATALVLADIVEGTSGPFTIGLFGDWGSGKTTIIKKATQYCRKHENIVVLSINPWEHDREEDASVSLLTDIADAIDSIPTQHRRNAIAEFSENLNRIVKSLASSISAKKLLTFGGVAATAANKPELGATLTGISEILPPEQNVPPPDQHSTWRQKKKALDESIPKDVKIAVFIDDLDRCEPSRAIDILEAIKQILWIPGIVFVLALDLKAIKSYLRNKYSSISAPDPDQFATKYLAKLVQTQIPISHRDNGTFSIFVQDEVSKAISFNAGWLPSSLSADAISQLIIAVAQRMPRQVKRLINNIIVELATFKRRTSSLDTTDCLGISLCRVLFDLSDHLSSNDDGFGSTSYVSLFEQLILDYDEAYQLVPTVSKTEASRNKNPQYRQLYSQWAAIGLSDILFLHDFDDWFLFRHKRLQWSSFAATESKRLRYIQDGIDDPLLPIRRSLEIDDDRPLPTVSRLSQITLGPGTDDRTLEYITSMTFPNLELLRINSSDVTDVGFKTLLINKFSRDIVTIEIESSALTNESAFSLSNANSFAKSLKTLYLLTPNISDEGYFELSRAWSTLSGLRKLVIRSSQFSDIGLAYLYDNDSCLLKLEHLQIIDTQITDDGLKQLAQSHRFSALEHLVVHGVKLSIETLKLFETHMPNCQIS